MLYKTALLYKIEEITELNKRSATIMNFSRHFGIVLNELQN